MAPLKRITLPIPKALHAKWKALEPHHTAEHFMEWGRRKSHGFDMRVYYDSELLWAPFDKAIGFALTDQIAWSYFEGPVPEDLYNHYRLAFLHGLTLASTPEGMKEFETFLRNRGKIPSEDPISPEVMERHAAKEPPPKKKKKDEPVVKYGRWYRIPVLLWDMLADWFPQVGLSGAQWIQHVFDDLPWDKPHRLDLVPQSKETRVVRLLLTKEQWAKLDENATRWDAPCKWTLCVRLYQYALQNGGTGTA